MIEIIIDQIILLKPLMITTGIGTAILLTMLLILSRKFSWNAWNVRIIGFFFDAKMSDSILLSICLVRFYLVISILVTKGKIDIVHILFYGGLILVYNIIRHRFKEMIVSIFNGVLIMGILYVSGFLISYLENVLFDIKIVIALIFLGIFLVLYALYDMAGCVLNIVNSREEVKFDEEEEID